jgi:lysophospholipase L1-like esterase
VTSLVGRQWLPGLLAVVVASAGVQAKPAWREAFQSSPATYEVPSDAFLQSAATAMKSTPERVKAGMSPQPVSGTVRYRVTVHAAGSQVRVRLSNEEGNAPLRLGAASIGLAGEAFAARPGSLQPLTFGGATKVTIPAGAPVVSDPVTLAVQPGTKLVISAALAAAMPNEGRGGEGFVAASGDQALRDTLDQPQPLTGRPLVSGVSVLSDPAPRVIVTFGDSITDGTRGKVDEPRGWAEELARRLASRKGGGSYTVVNAGIGGNRLLAPGWGAAGLARLDRDALRIEGISHLILLEGTNDIGFSGKGPFGDNPEIAAADLIAGYRQVVARAHARGIKVYLGTLTPNTGSPSHSSPAKDALREAVNRWIRTSGEPDAVIDFDAMVRDPATSNNFLAVYDSGDHLHPSNAGYKAMGSGIDLGLFP